MQTLNLNLALRPMRLAAATFVLALAAGISQTAVAQPGEGGFHARHGGHGGGMAGGMGLMRPHQMERVFDSVNATPDQRAQIKQIVEGARADLMGQHEVRRRLHDQSRALFAQPAVDARAAEALRQQMLAQHDQASKRVLQAMLEISRVLSPEQRKTLADKMAQRRAMMERHRAERAAQNPATR